MNLEIDFRSGIPIYLQLVARIKEMLASGRLKPGDQLPTVRALAQDLRVNFNTIARAYRILNETGIISTQQGRGTYILEMPSQEASTQIQAQALRALAKRYITEAARLGSAPQDILKEVSDQVKRWNRTGSLDNSTETEID